MLIMNFLTTDITTLHSGKGIDGMWYDKVILKEDYKPSDYHIFKSLPSYLIKKIFEVFDVKKNHNNILFSFKILNFTVVFLSFFILKKISNCFFKDKNKIFIIFSFLSFIVLKVSSYDVMTPDYFGFFLSSLILYLYLLKYNLLMIPALSMALFTNPIVFMLGMVLLIFSNTYSKKVKHFKQVKAALILSCLFGITIIFWASYMIVPMYKAGIELTKWHIPDSLDIELFPVSALLISAFCAYFSYPLFQQSFHFLHFKNLLKVNLFWIVIFIAFMVLKSIVVNLNNSPTELDDFGHLLYMWPLYFCMKPLIGISEHIHSLGLLIVFALLMWKDLVSECSKLFGLGGLIILGLFVLFIIKSEARHTLPFIPFLSLLVARVIPDNFFNRKNILIVFITSLILSKFYYPIQLAEFSCDPQDFPAQQYFMFFGFSCNYTMYLIQIIISFFILIYIKKLISRNDLSSL